MNLTQSTKGGFKQVNPVRWGELEARGLNPGREGLSIERAGALEGLHVKVIGCEGKRVIRREQVENGGTWIEVHT
jgi:hypothetical protein